MVTPAACVPSSPGSESIAGAVPSPRLSSRVCVCNCAPDIFSSSAASIVQRAKCDQRR